MCTLTQRHAAAVIFLVLLLVMPVDAGRSAISFPSAGVVTVCEVIDGDTFSIYPPGWLEGVDPGEYGPDEPYRHTVRLIGINTPERHRPGYEEATAALEELLPPGTQVCLTADLDERDGSNPWRWLAYAETLSCDDVGAELLDEGWAVAWRYLPNCERAEEYRQLMSGAFTAGRGVFALDPPAVYVASDEQDSYHRMGCGHASRIDAGNLVAVFDAQMLVTAGKLRCAFCIPDDEVWD